jgi:hypothetical protein
MATIDELNREIAAIKKTIAILKQDLIEITNETLDANVAISAAERAGNAAEVSRQKAIVRDLRDQQRETEASIERNDNLLGPLGAQLARAEQAARQPIRATDSAGTIVANAQIARDDQANTQNPSTPAGVLTPDGRVQTAVPASTNAQILSTTETNPTAGINAPIRTAESTQAPADATGGAGGASGAVVTPGVAGGAGGAVVTPGGPGAASQPDDNTVSTQPAQTATPVGNSNNPPGPAAPPQDNILDQYQSYTYNIAVYMISTAAYRSIAETKVFSPAGSQLLFSSGGAPVAGQTDPNIGQRSPFFPTDYYIDNVELTSLLSNQGTGMPHNSVELNFTVTETNGITLLQNLTQAAGQQQANNPTDNRGYLNQLYLMVIKFYGYDSSGNLVSGVSGPGPTITKYIPFVVANLGFKIASRAVEYSWECLTLQETVATGPKFASVPFNIEYSARTLKQSIETLLNAINKFQKRLYDQKLIKIPNNYSVEFTQDSMGDALVTFNGTVNKKTTPMNSGETPADQKLPSKQSAKLDTRRFSVTAGTQLTQFIEQTVRTSQYVIRQQNVLIDPKTNKVSDNPQAAASPEWFKINRFCIPKGYDDIVQDFAYDIIYTISPYVVSAMGSEYFNNPPFPGFHKRYPYWFTGENIAVISYEQEFNALYYLTLSGLTNPGSTRGYFPNVKKAYQTSSAQSSQQTPGIVGEPGSNAADFFYSPGDQGQASLTIIGDPAWIFQGEVVGGLRKGQWTRGQFLSDGTINTDAGEALFLIYFNLPNDYDVNGSGLADPNQLSTQAARPGLTGAAQQGYPYQAVQVVSKFKKGQFTQDITGLLVMTQEATDAARGTSPVSYNSTLTDPQQQAATALQNTPGSTAPNSNVTTNILGNVLGNALGTVQQGVNQVLSPVTQTINATLAQIQSSTAYITAIQQGLTEDAAIAFAKQALSNSTANQPSTPGLTNIVKDQ